MGEKIAAIDLAAGEGKRMGTKKQQEKKKKKKTKTQNKKC